MRTTSIKTRIETLFRASCNMRIGALRTTSIKTRIETYASSRGVSILIVFENHFHQNKD
ncbi:Uncharacterized protein dnm_098320 [Desulfonema magnum]|uniref:Uncharacterized protein n=1 Tax=Desulfonema magnum TaxID=45655 RepID=A0A975BXX7_9BACT|nr:Uncharacterized protein dnm_098320 [Desulfonema magnum]